MDLFSLPFELRRKIYAGAWAPELKLHLFLRDGLLEQSPCLGANLGEELLEDRYVTGDRGENYIRRLQSSWGPHYMCEERQMGIVPYPDHPDRPGTTEHKSISMLLVCKQMHIDCLELVKEQLDVQITDLETALFLAKIGQPGADPPSLPPGPATPVMRSPIFREIRSLSLCLFAALEVYPRLGCKVPSHGGPGQPPEGGSEVPPAEAAPKLRLWRHIWPSLAALPHLERLSVWLDHDGVTWSDTDERALLQPLALAGWRDTVRVAVHMPRLPTDKIRPALHHHMDNAEEGLPFRTVRRVRRPDLSPLGEECVGNFPDVEEDAKDGDWGVTAELNPWSG